MNTQNKLRLNNLSMVIFVTIVILFIAPCSAYYQVNKVSTLKFTCTVNNAVPSSSAVFNFTIDNPDGSTFLPMTLATPLGQGLFNYSLNIPVPGVYSIHEFCYDTSGSNSNTENIIVNLSGTEVTPVNISIYIFFLLISLVLTFLSVRLARANSIEHDLTDNQMYELKKAHEFQFYIEMIRKKFWIVGVFGVYLSILLFVSILTNLVLNLNLLDIYSIISNVVIVLLWGLIPFIVFWIGYIIIYFYKQTEKVMKYQFGRGLKE